MTAAGLQIDIELDYRDFTLAVDLALPARGVSVLFGRSGSGKTSLLRCIAGLENAARGHIAFDGDTWQDRGHFTPTHRRPLGYVFQEASLFSHLSAGDNLRFAARRADKNSAGIDFPRAVALLDLGDLLHRSPAQLSGGERQRIAIARALLIKPRLLLMDEPLASLDIGRKRDILPYLETLKNELDLPIVYVTHAPDEVARLADHLAALDNGRVVAQGSLAETLNALDFPIALGEEAGAVIEARIAERDTHWHLARATFPGGELWFRDNNHPVGDRIRLRILARDISLGIQHDDTTSIINALPATIVDIVPDDHPALALVKLRAGTDANAGSTLIARVTRRSAHNLQLAAGLGVWAQVKSVAIVE